MKMLYAQEHREQTHLYWSEDDNIANRISIGKLDQILDIKTMLFANKSANKRAILKLLILFDRNNLVDFFNQSKSVVLAELSEVRKNLP